LKKHSSYKDVKVYAIKQSAAMKPTENNASNAAKKSLLLLCLEGLRLFENKNHNFSATITYNQLEHSQVSNYM
jgi:hypothetical protein